MNTDNIVIGLAEALYDDDVDRARSLLTDNPEYISSGHGGHPWIQLAARRRNLQMVQMLIALGADVNAEEDYPERMTALDIAIGRANVPIVRVLLEHGANPNRDREVIGAISKRDVALELVKLLEQHGADLHRVFKNEITGEPMNALSMALDCQQQDVVEYLISKGCVLPEGFSRRESP